MFSVVMRAIAQLRQENMELQTRVKRLEQLMEKMKFSDATNSGYTHDVITSKQSLEDTKNRITSDAMFRKSLVSDL
jgi:hypothetical protein